MKVQNYNFYTVFSWMTTALKLSGNELAIFAIVYSFSQDGKSEFTGSLKYISQFTNTNKQTVINTLNKLISKKYIIKRQYLDGALPRNAYKANLNYVADIEAKEDKSKLENAYTSN